MRFTTNEELWEYQSTFLNERSFHVFEQDEYSCKDPIVFYNRGAVMSYLMRFALPGLTREGSKSHQRMAKLYTYMEEYLKMPGDVLRCFNYSVRLTDEPFPRILSRYESEDELSYVLVKRLDDIPVLCKCRLEDISSGKLAGIHFPNVISQESIISDERSEPCGVTVWAQSTSGPKIFRHGVIHDSSGEDAAYGTVAVTGLIDPKTNIPCEFFMEDYLRWKTTMNRGHGSTHIFADYHGCQDPTRYSFYEQFKGDIAGGYMMPNRFEVRYKRSWFNDEYDTYHGIL